MKKNINFINKSFDPNKKSDSRSIVNNTLLIFIPVFISIVSIIIITLAISENLEMKTFQNKEETIVNSKLEHIQAEILQVANDLMILTLNSQMDKLWDSSSNAEIVESITKDFLNAAVYRKLYDQVRLINENGKEVIRVNFNNGNPVIVPQEKLQNKADRYYFYDAFKLSKGEVFVSPLDLNIEHGEIEQPLKPIIRFATPVFDLKGKKRGIVLLNYFGQIIINQLINNKNPLIESRIMLLNADGYWFKGLSPEYEWGFMYEDKKDIRFENTYANEWELIKREESSQFETKQGMFTFNTIHPLFEGQKTSTGSGKAFLPSKAQLKADEYFWKIVSFIPSEILYAKRNMYRKYAALLLALLSMSSFFISWRLAKTKYYRVKAQQALKESEEKYRIVADFTYDWEYWTDSNGDFIYVSPSSEQISGYTPEDFYNDKDLMIKIIHPEDKNIMSNHKHHLDKTSESKPIEFRIITQKNEIQWIGHVCQKVFGDDGKDLGIRGGNRLITDCKKAELALQESNVAKDKFFSIIAHDLKSPFNSMLGFSKLLVKNFDKYNIQEQKSFIGNIHDSVHNTYKLLENLLLWSRTQRGTLDFNPEPENLYLILVETIELLSQSATNKSINIKNEVSEDIFVKADKNMLSTVLRNLISNAIKFTHKAGEIIIEAQLRNDKNKQDFIEISVRDNGVGIKPEIQSKLFSISEDISTKGTENEAGTGLGLILCKEFVEKHGDKIWVESEEAQGSKFIFTIPATL